MNITRKDVEHVASLARLQFSPDELDLYTQQLNSILNHFQKLQNVDTTDVPSSTHAVDVNNAFREDTAGPSLTTEESLKNAPEAEQTCFKVPKIIEVG